MEENLKENENKLKIQEIALEKFVEKYYNETGNSPCDECEEFNDLIDGYP